MTTVTTDEIVAAIRGGEHKFEGIQRRLGVCASDFRVVDRALQKARKKGLIKYERGMGWEVVERKRGAEAVTAPTPALSVEEDRERIEAFVARFANPHCICWLPADTDALLALLAEVRADEREACARVCRRSPSARSSAG